MARHLPLEAPDSSVCIYFLQACVCAHANVSVRIVYRHAQLHALGKQKFSLSSSVTSHLVFFQAGSLTEPGVQTRLHWLTNELRGPACLCAPALGLRSVPQHPACMEALACMYPS